jgi:putative heme-binding domain-containing protein
VALDDTRTLEDRLIAVALLSGAPYGQLAPLAQELLDARQPLELQLAAVRVSSSVDDPQIASVLLAHWVSLGPKVQIAVMDAIFSRQNRLSVLLDALEKGILRPSSLDAIQRVHLLENPTAAVRQRAKSLLPTSGVRKDREEVLARYTAALAAPRDAGRGQLAFEKLCSKCHVAQGKGSVVGPDLSVTNRKSDEMLLADVLDPSNQITVGYNSYTVVTQNGHVFSGILAAETATSVTLRRELAAEDTILRKDIEVLQASTISQMPENLENEVSPQEVADLITYLREAFGPASGSVVTLFEDDASFATMLSEGAGTATIETGDRFSGAAALAITPPQRWNLNIPGWQYRITEKPGPGEFRYLRWAWKSRGGQGVMIELAGGGRWPPPDKPLWRYYSGANTTGWAAMQVSPDAPREWTVVTRDLWKDFGPFTLTGIAPTASGGIGLFDRIELLRSLDSVKPGQ